MNINNLILLLKGTLITIKISLLSIIIGMILGILCGLLNNNKVKIFIITYIIKIYIALIRGTPISIQLLIIYFTIPHMTHVSISPIMAGILTLSLNSTAYLSEIIRSGINSINNQQWYTAKILGYSKIQNICYIIFPQAIYKILPSITNELTALIKESSILMIIGVPELTHISKNIVARELNPMEIYIYTAILYFITTYIVTHITKILERKKSWH